MVESSAASAIASISAATTAVRRPAAAACALSRVTGSVLPTRGPFLEVSCPLHMSAADSFAFDPDAAGGWSVGWAVRRRRPRDGLHPSVEGP
ncbi:hypothetical protein GCM10010340_50880 [Streptomyces griseoloalbus]|nr:hypothetical protein GCM10010294_53600 [Streptomyces griseoloalbus]GGW66459.1 hypothetical protein GCM10010340_50880 [Streptomyces albaduncus]